MEDGSMHSFEKEYHVMNLDQLDNFLSVNHDYHSITTPGLTYKEFKLPRLLEYFSSIPSWETDHKIMIYQPCVRSAELNLIFKYYKMWLPRGVNIMYGDHVEDWRQWNPQCNHWSELETWQSREWFSLFYPESVQEFIDAPSHVDDSWLVLTNLDVLYDTTASLVRMIDFCNLQPQGDLNSFVSQWQQAQDYIVEEFELIDSIVEHTVNYTHLEWEGLCFVSEAIVQKRLRDQGYEIRCHGLNHFPTDTKHLSQLLERKNHA